MNKAIIFLIIAASILLLGQEGCPQTGGTQTKSGMEFSLQTGPGFLSSGLVIEQGQGFYVGVGIKNYDAEKRTGTFCIRDNIADTYAGIDEDCEDFTIPAAEIYEDSVEAGEKTIFFPKNGEYYYDNLPIGQRGILYADFFYRQIQKATGQVEIPEGTIILNNMAAPISVSASASSYQIRDTGEQKISLDITLKRNAKEILLPDFSQKNKIIFSASLGALDLDCDEKGVMEFKNEKLIRCSALTSLGREQQISYPLIINLDYGVEDLKQYSFTIKENEK